MPKSSNGLGCAVVTTSPRSRWVQPEQVHVSLASGLWARPSLTSINRHVGGFRVLAIDVMLQWARGCGDLVKLGLDMHTRGVAGSRGSSVFKCGGTPILSPHPRQHLSLVFSMIDVLTGER